MSNLFYRNRQTGDLEEEHVYGGPILRLFYGQSKLSRYVGRFLAYVIAYCPWVSKLYGWSQRRKWSKRKILPFIQRYRLKPEEFAVDPSTFVSFDAFFTRQLRPEGRVIAAGDDVAIIPADGRYRFFPKIDEATLFGIKGSTFNLAKLLQDPQLAKSYEQGSMIIARLAPCDYHRFHFPCACTPKEAVPLNGPLYSVNPLALQRNLGILWQNKRVLTVLESPSFGDILYIEVGATNVGTIHQTYMPGVSYVKGAEKGYFSFGGSTVILLFEKDRLVLDADLIQASKCDEELLCQMGQSMGRAQEKEENE